MNRDVLSDFVGHPGFVWHSARSEGEAQNLGLPRTHLVDHSSTRRPIDSAIQCCAVHMTVDAFTFGRHGDSFGTVASQGLAAILFDNSGRPIIRQRDPHEPRCSDLQVTQVSSGILRGLQNLGLPRTHLLELHSTAS